MSSVLIRTRCHSAIGHHRIIRSASVSAVPKLGIDSNYDATKGYKDIPGMSRLQFVRAFMPGGNTTKLAIFLLFYEKFVTGKLYGAGLIEMHKQV